MSSRAGLAINSSQLDESALSGCAAFANNQLRNVDAKVVAQSCSNNWNFAKAIRNSRDLRLLKPRWLRASKFGKVALKRKNFGNAMRARLPTFAPWFGFNTRVSVQLATDTAVQCIRKISSGAVIFLPWFVELVSGVKCMTDAYLILCVYKL